VLSYYPTHRFEDAARAAGLTAPQATPDGHYLVFRKDEG
jgi:hypothetical protein